MANFVCFLAARKSKVPWDLHVEGLSAGNQRLVAYVSKETHTWIDKAAELFGLGAKSIRWIDTNADQQMDIDSLEKQIKIDRADNHLPFLVVGAAGTVGTGIIDFLPEIAAICRLQAMTQNLSITTFRFVPLDLPNDPTAVEDYLNELNEELLNRLQKSGEAFISKAVVEGKYLLRACIVNFRTTLSDVEALPEIVIRIGRKLDSEFVITALACAICAARSITAWGISS